MFKSLKSWRLLKQDEHGVHTPSTCLGIPVPLNAVQFNGPAIKSLLWYCDFGNKHLIELYISHILPITNTLWASCP